MPERVQLAVRRRRQQNADIDVYLIGAIIRRATVVG